MKANSNQKTIEIIYKSKKRSWYPVALHLFKCMKLCDLMTGERFFSVDERILEIVTGEKALQFVGIKSSQDSSVSEWDIFIP